MSVRSTTAVGGATLVLLAAVGCSSSQPTPKDQGTQSTAATSTSHDGEEVGTNGCDKNAFDVAQPVTVNVGGVRGMLSLRKSGNGLCNEIYWARFQPSPGNAAGFKVVVSDNNTGKQYTQLSEPHNPAITAWSRGLYAPIGHQVKGCVVGPHDNQTCLTTVVV